MLLALLLSPLSAQQIVFDQNCTKYKGIEHAVVRMLSSAQKVLLVNTSSLTTSIISSKELSHLSQCVHDSRYQNLKRELLATPQSIINRGLKYGLKDAYALTVDMCPSRKSGMDKAFFLALQNGVKSFPVTISMTKKWALSHPKEFEQLKAWDDKKDLNITWMNHGASHPYKADLPIEENFINLEGVDFKKEVLDNEAFLIQEGRIPSIFYRFAGLVSNERAFRCLVQDLGLIPIGSRAWLAKGEALREGSIVLVHGNKNEPLGIRRFLQIKVKPPVVGLSRMFSEE